MSSSPIKVLLIEDNRGHAELIKLAFRIRRNEFDVLHATSLAEGETLLRETHPAAIVCDYLLPDGDGLTFIRSHIENSPLAPPLILITSHGDEAVAVEAIKAGATDYIVKAPGFFTALPDLCKSIVREHRQRLETSRAEGELAEKQRLNEMLLGALPHPALLVRGRDRTVIAANQIAIRHGARIGQQCWRMFSHQGMLSEEHEALADLHVGAVPEELGIRCSCCRAEQCLVKEPEQNECLADGSGMVWDTYWIKASDDVFLHYLVDMTERIHSENVLRESRERYRLLAESTSGIVWEYDAGRDRWTYVAPQAELILGYAPEEWTDLGWWLERLHPDDRESALQVLYPAALKEGSRSFEYRFMAKDGRTVWLNNIVTVDAADGGAVMIRGILLDITERKQMEEKLRQSLKMESIGRLAGGVAHDFNNKLTVILGYAELLRQEYPGDRLLQQHLGEISKAAEHSRDITSQLLAFSRQQVASPRPVDITRVLTGMRKTLPRLIGEDIILDCNLRDVWSVMIDPTQLDQIVMNLAINARDAMPRGGRLTITTGNSFVDETCCCGSPDSLPGDYVELTVSDTGHGMEADVCQRVFEPFFTTKEIGRGTGLGLSTVYGIVAQNQGIITVDSTPGCGTTFRVYLPRHDSPAVDIEPQAAPAQSRGSGTILLVEDDPSVSTTVTSMLEVLGYTVLKTATPTEALAICGDLHVPIDLVLSDVIMPAMGGRELLERIIRLRPGIKALFMSGYPMEVISSKGTPDDIPLLRKPFDIRTLSAAVGKLLSTAQRYGLHPFPVAIPVGDGSIATGT